MLTSHILTIAFKDAIDREDRIVFRRPSLFGDLLVE